MIKKTLIAFSIFALVALSFAGPPAPPATIVQDEVVNILTARAFEASVYGTFAPKLVGSGRYGSGLSLTHPIGDYGFAGLRFDLLGSAYTAGTFGGGLKAPFVVYGHKITPYAGTGIKSVLQGDPAQVGKVSLSAYSGADVSLWTNKAGTVELGVKGEVEFDSAYAGIQIFHGGGYVSVKF